MGNIDLFEKQSIVGAKIERIITDKGITKSEICNSTGVSKPTLDKLLKGQLTNRINYNKHINKIMSFLKVSENDLLGHENENENQIRTLRSIFGKTQQEVADYIGTDINRYVQIEEGEEATLAELRDIAVCFSTGVRNLLGENYFSTQIAEPDFLVPKNNKQRVSGFWGHIGILTMNSDEYLWYPVTSKVRNDVYEMMNQEWMIIPCMNNILLVINSNNIKEVVFSDFDCDQPGFANWDSSVDCGDKPLVFYEAFMDYYCECYEETMSKKFKTAIEKLISKEKIDINDFADRMELSNIYFLDGKSSYAHIDLKEYDDIVFAITNIYEFQDYDMFDKFIPYVDHDGTERLLNTQNVSMMELPLIDVETAISNMYYEMRMEDEKMQEQ